MRRIDRSQITPALGDLCCPVCGGGREGALVLLEGATARTVRAHCLHCRLLWCFRNEDRDAAQTAEPARAAPGDDLAALRAAHGAQLEALIGRAG